MSFLRPKFITSTFSSKKRKRKNSESNSFNIKGLTSELDEKKDNLSKEESTSVDNDEKITWTDDHEIFEKDLVSNFGKWKELS